MTKTDKRVEALVRSERVLARGAGPRKLQPAPPPETPGSADWLARSVFGSSQEFERLLTGLVLGGGEQVEERWRRAVSLMVRLKEREVDYTLNQICVTLDISFEEMARFVGEGTAQVWGQLARMKASLAAPQVIESAIAASQDWEKGGKDREMLLKIAGVLDEAKGGVNVQVTQQVGVAIGKEALLAPLRQFREASEEIDQAVRGEVVEGEVVDG